MNQIHPLAVVSPDAQLGDNNVIGPFCVIYDNVVMGDNNRLLNSVTIHSGARIGSGNEFFPLLLNEFKPIIMEFWLRSIRQFGAAANVHLAKRYLDYIRRGDAEGAFRRLERSVNEYLACFDKQ